MDQFSRELTCTAALTGNASARALQVRYPKEPQGMSRDGITFAKK